MVLFFSVLSYMLSQMDQVIKIRNKRSKIRKEVRRLGLKKELILSPQNSKTYVFGNRKEMEKLTEGWNKKILSVLFLISSV